MRFAFENLDVYQRSVQFVSQIEKLTETLKGRLSYSIVDQLTRAALSVPLNIAEGNGRWHENDRKKFFWIARGSLFEVVPIIQVIRAKGLLSDEMYQDFYRQLTIMSKMIANLIKAADRIDKKVVSQ